jgi:hypothetical protein
MIRGEPGLDVLALVRGVLKTSDDGRPSGLAIRLAQNVPAIHRGHEIPEAANPYERLWSSDFGVLAASLFKDERPLLESISAVSVEIVFEYLTHRFAQRDRLRFLSVPGGPYERPSLLILNPDISDISESSRVTDALQMTPAALVEAFERIRPALADAADPRLLVALEATGDSGVMELLWISQPEVVVTRRPRMEKLCSPSPHITIRTTTDTSSAGIFCHDSSGILGVTGCYHGTGPAGTPVTVGGTASHVARAEPVQDLVFIPLPDTFVVSRLCGLRGVRTSRAPSEGEPVAFEGAGTGTRADTRVKSHDAGLFRKSKGLQLKVQTPADTNRGDSGCALVDSDDRIIGFAFERTGYGEFPELTDWIWADNALSTLNLTALEHPRRTHGLA